ncbi:DUF1285 domain-containing protein [Alteromonas aestuariivivens]|uniref:DUF1285 domain-containing protein n=1 Tax=Alteromonas aestuariivivens TaxID=1938339 RepID=A0A3D8M573_9ALTE|nr:DUF1285 domain-containing protein [Alteromonas aestuariivivens]RDV24816.1 DUF1285 domain-containing protein [Alteromonas aestuariivivens]
MDLTRFEHQLAGTGDKGSRALPPVEQWDPPFCGNINLVIKADGRWYYDGSPIGRIALVKLFASVLKREQNQYFLVTPVEKVGIEVEDVPFVITQWHCHNELLQLTTQTEDEFTVDAEHPVELRPPPDSLKAPDSVAIPYVRVRRNLWGRLHQNVYYQLLEKATPVAISKHEISLQLHSGQYQFSIGCLPADSA